MIRTFRAALLPAAFVACLGLGLATSSQADEDGCGAEQIPVQLGRAFLQSARAGAATGLLDDRACDLAIGFAIGWYGHGARNNWIIAFGIVVIIAEPGAPRKQVGPSGLSSPP